MHQYTKICEIYIVSISIHNMQNKEFSVLLQDGNVICHVGALELIEPRVCFGLFLNRNSTLQNLKLSSLNLNPALCTVRSDKDKNLSIGCADLHKRFLPIKQCWKPNSMTMVLLTRLFPGR